MDDFLYEAIFVPEGVEAPPKEIINAPELKGRGYQKTSLAVQKENYAVKMYKNVGLRLLMKTKKNISWCAYCNCLIGCDTINIDIKKEAVI